jgi:hypothetical protein
MLQSRHGRGDCRDGRDTEALRGFGPPMRCLCAAYAPCRSPAAMLAEHATAASAWLRHSRVGGDPGLAAEGLAPDAGSTVALRCRWVAQTRRPRFIPPAFPRDADSGCNAALRPGRRGLENRCGPFGTEGSNPSPSVLGSENPLVLQRFREPGCDPAARPQLAPAGPARRHICAALCSTPALQHIRRHIPVVARSR